MDSKQHDVQHSKTQSDLPNVLNSSISTEKKNGKITGVQSVSQKSSIMFSANEGKHTESSAPAPPMYAPTPSFFKMLSKYIAQFDQR